MSKRFTIEVYRTITERAVVAVDARDQEEAELKAQLRAYSLEQDQWAVANVALLRDWWALDTTPDPVPFEPEPKG